MGKFAINSSAGHTRPLSFNSNLRANKVYAEVSKYKNRGKKDEKPLYNLYIER